MMLSYAGGMFVLAALSIVALCGVPWGKIGGWFRRCFWDTWVVFFTGRIWGD